MQGSEVGAEGMPTGLEHSRPVFDRTTRLAKGMFGAVNAQITLKTAEGYWRSRAGDLEKDSKASGVREVMRTGEVLWVEDARRDPRFCNEPEVAREGGVAFFAGAPIRLPDGETPGVLWVAGAEPRPYDASLARRLQDLADFAADEWTRVTAAQAKRTYQHTMSAIVDAMRAGRPGCDRQDPVRTAARDGRPVARGPEERPGGPHQDAGAHGAASARWRDRMAPGAGDALV